MQVDPNAVRVGGARQRVVEAARETAGNGAFKSLAIRRAAQLNAHAMQLRIGDRSRRKRCWIEIQANKLGERFLGFRPIQSKR